MTFEGEFFIILMHQMRIFRMRQGWAITENLINFNAKFYEIQKKFHSNMKNGVLVFKNLIVNGNFKEFIELKLSFVIKTFVEI